MNVKRLVALAIALLMLVAVVPVGASAAGTGIDYSVYDVGPKLRAQTPSASLIDLSSGESFSGGGSGAAGPADFVEGDEAYWLGLNDYAGNYQVKKYTMWAMGENAEIWVANNLAFPPGDLRAYPVITQDQVDYLLEELEENILPTMTQYFRAPDYHDGSNAYLPSLLGLPADYYSGDKLVVLVDNVRDDNYYDPTYPNYIAGFYSPSYEIYFDRNIITIDSHDWANRIGPNVARPYLYEGIIAHELQHLLHDDVDSDEDTFLNEGLSDFAMVVCGYASAASHLDGLKAHPENSLVAWEDQGGLEILADYGIAFLWTYYLWEKFGTQFIKDMFNDELNGIVSVNSLLQSISKGLHFDETFRDFSVAMLIDSSMANYRYGFRTLNFTIDMGSPTAPNVETFNTPGAPAWGTDYMWIGKNDLKKVKLMFDGMNEIKKDTAWTSDGDVLWSGTGDLLDNWAIFEAQGGGTLTFDTLWDLEDYWDFGFVQVSTDNGATWTSLANDYTTGDYDPNAHPKVIANLPGLTSYVTDWVTMSFDLAAYEGQDILIAFRLVTDWATHYGGWYIDNVYVDDVLISDGSDVSNFKDITNYRPVNVDFSVTLVGYKMSQKGNQYKVLNMKLDDMTETGLYEAQSVLSWSNTAVLLVTYQAEPDNVDYAGYSYSFVGKK